MRGLIALAALVALAGCAAAPTQDAGIAPGGARRVAATSGGFDCKTTNLYVVTTSQCGSGGFDLLSAAGD